MGINAEFRLIMQNDGTYLELVPHKNGGSQINFSELDEYLYQRGISYDKKMVSDTINSLLERKIIRLDGTVRRPEGESVKVTVSDDHMQAVGRFYPPSNGGAVLNRTEIMNDLIRVGVKYGVVEENIKYFLETKTYFTDIVLAKATPYTPGKDAAITYYFNTDLSKKPKMNDDGTVDFHQLDTISHIKKDELLASLEPAVPGRPGISVSGVTILPPKVENLILHYGSKIRLSDDKLKIYSEVDGHVMLVNDKVFVSDTYDIKADVDASTGDVKYDGNVTIKGCVRTGYNVIANGDIIVEGVVEGATLDAGGQIILKRGIQGMNKGVLKARGNIVTKFIENATVETQGYLTTEAILHSKISAKGDVIVGGKKGFITGGEIRSGTAISVKTAGSTMGTNTLLEVGIDPTIVEEYHKLEKEIAPIGLEIERVNQNLLLYLKKLKSGEKLPTDKLILIKSMSVNKETLEKKRDDTLARLNELQEYMENHQSGCIHVSDTIYPGCKVVIAGVVYFVRKETIHCTLVRDNADIIVGPYRL